MTLRGEAGEAPVAATSDRPLPDVLKDGHYTLTVTARNGPGNETSKSCAFTVDTVTALPFTVSSSALYEGDEIGLYADSTGATGNAGGSWVGKTWQWSVAQPSHDEPTTFDGPIGYVTLPTAGDYHVRMTVTDAATGAICVADKTLSAQPEPPRVHALNVEVLNGRPTTLLARFLDRGWEQTHTATWTIDGVGSFGGAVSRGQLPRHRLWLRNRPTPHHSTHPTSPIKVTSL